MSNKHIHHPYSITYVIFRKEFCYAVSWSIDFKKKIQKYWGNEIKVVQLLLPVDIYRKRDCNILKTGHFLPWLSSCPRSWSRRASMSAFCLAGSKPSTRTVTGTDRNCCEMQSEPRFPAVTSPISASSSSSFSVLLFCSRKRYKH